MFHEAAAHLIDLAEGLAPATDNSTVTVALIGAASLILSGLIAGYFGTRGDKASRLAKSSDSENFHTKLQEAQWDSAHAEDEQREAELKLVAAEYRISVLERAFYLRGYDAKRFVTGEETDEQTRIAPHG